MDDIASWFVLSSISTQTKSNLQLLSEFKTLNLIWSSYGDLFSTPLYQPTCTYTCLACPKSSSILERRSTCSQVGGTTNLAGMQGGFRTDRLFQSIPSKKGCSLIFSIESLFFGSSSSRPLSKLSSSGLIPSSCFSSTGSHSSLPETMFLKT